MNSKDETNISELGVCSKHFENSGYSREKLMQSEEPSGNVIRSESLVFPIYYFNGVFNEVKTIVHSLENEHKGLIGDAGVMFAKKKKSSICKCVLRNKQQSLPNNNSNKLQCNVQLLSTLQT